MTQEAVHLPEIKHELEMLLFVKLSLQSDPTCNHKSQGKDISLRQGRTV